MTEPNPKPEQPTADDLRDRLVEQSLSEVVGGTTPPDVTGRVAGSRLADQPQLASKPHFTKSAWFWAPVAAVVLIAFGIALQSPPHKPVAHNSAPQAQPDRSGALTPLSDREVVYRDDAKISEEIGANSSAGGAAPADHPFAPKSSTLSHLYGLEGKGEVSTKSLARQKGDPLLPTGQPARPTTPTPGIHPTGSAMPASGPVPTAAPHPGPVNYYDQSTTTGKEDRWGDVGGQGNKKAFPVALPLVVSNPHPTANKPGEPKPLAGLVVGKEQLKELEEAEQLLQQVEGIGGEGYAPLTENLFLPIDHNTLSTFSIDVDTASYANVRRFLTSNQLPPAAAVRTEELVNYFRYDYVGPTDNKPFSAQLEAATCPWNPKHRLVRVALKGKEVPVEKRPPSNLVFLLDVSGSMDSYDKLPLLKQSFRMLVEQLSDRDRVAIVVYAGASGLVLPSTFGNKKQTILDALDQLQAGGSTNGGAGIELAYKVAQENFIKEGNNRVILATDGDFNVGNVSLDGLKELITEKKQTGVFLSVLGFGTGNVKDQTMEMLADKGNGNYNYLDTVAEGRKVLVEEIAGTLLTIAKDVKLQIEFNPQQVAAYRLVGYENRVLANQDFNDDTKDAGEIGAGHTVTAFYEVVPVGVDVPKPHQALPAKEPLPPNTTLKYAADGEKNEDLLTLKVKYKQPDAAASEAAQEFSLVDAGKQFSQATNEFKFAAAVAEFALILRDSKYKGDSNLAAVLEIAGAAKGSDLLGYRAEFVDLVGKAKVLWDAQHPAAGAQPAAQPAAQPGE